MSPATLDAPNSECLDWSMVKLSLIPSQYAGSSYSQRVSSSLSGIRFGASPYTLLVDMWTNGISGHACRTASNRLSVPTAFTSKSSNGRDAARSWLGCAAVWITASGWISRTNSNMPGPVAEIQFVMLETRRIR